MTTQPTGYLVDGYGNPLKNGFYIDPTGVVSAVALNSTGQQVVTPIGGSGGATAYTALTDASTANLPAVNVPLSTTLGGINTSIGGINTSLTTVNTALGVRALVNSTQVTQQSAGATTVLFNATKTAFKDPAGGSDIALSSGTALPLSVSYSTTIPLDGNKTSPNHVFTTTEALTLGAVVEGGSYQISFVAGTSAVAPTFSSSINTLPGSDIVNVTTGRVSLLTFGYTGGSAYVRITDTGIIAPTQPVFTAQSAPSGNTGQAYTYTYVASGGGVMTFALFSGSLPAGVTLNGATGVISGTLTTAATSSFVISATNSVGTTNSSAQTVVVSVAATPRTDNFTRANNASSLGTPSDGGSAWVTSGLVAAITSNHGNFVEQGTVVTGISYLEQTGKNSAAQVTIQVSEQYFSFYPGLLFGVVDASNYYKTTIDKYGNLVLTKIVAGVSTQLSSYAIPSFSYSGTYTLATTLNTGTGAITVSVGGTVVMSATDTSLNTGTKAGITAVSTNTGGYLPNNTFTAFSAS